MTIDQGKLESTKINKVLPRLLKRGDDRVKLLSQKILDNSTDISQPKSANGKLNKGQRSSEVPRSPVDNKDIKREQAENSRKNSSSTSKASNSTKAKSVSGSENRPSSVKSEAKPATKTPVADATGAKVKINQVTTKPTGFFAGLKSASKKPRTSAKAEDGKSG